MHAGGRGFNSLILHTFLFIVVTFSGAEPCSCDVIAAVSCHAAAASKQRPWAGVCMGRRLGLCHPSLWPSWSKALCSGRSLRAGVRIPLVTLPCASFWFWMGKSALPLPAGWLAGAASRQQHLTFLFLLAGGGGRNHGGVDIGPGRAGHASSIWPSGLRRRVKAAVFWAGVRIPLWTHVFCFCRRCLRRCHWHTQAQSVKKLRP